MPRNWITEHGAEYAVPAELAELADHSWSNDAAPSFGVQDENGSLLIFVEHPDPAMREIPGGRYLVGRLGDAEADLYHGDDLAAALAAYREHAATDPARWLK